MWANAMSKPAPLSRTKKTLPPSRDSTPTSIWASSTRLVNFHAFPTRLSKTTRSKLPVGLNREAGLDRDADLSFGLPAAKLFTYGAHHLGHVDSFAAQLRAADPREREEVVDELAHARGAGANPAQVVAASLVEPVAVLVEEVHG